MNADPIEIVNLQLDQLVCRSEPLTWISFDFVPSKMAQVSQVELPFAMAMTKSTAALERELISCHHGVVGQSCAQRLNAMQLLKIDFMVCTFESLPMCI